MGVSKTSEKEPLLSKSDRTQMKYGLQFVTCELPALNSLSEGWRLYVPLPSRLKLTGAATLDLSAREAVETFGSSKGGRSWGESCGFSLPLHLQ